VHGTTIATNALLEGKGATLGILATQGFEDVLFIGRTKRTEMYNLMMDAEEPLFLAPRNRIVGIPERVDATGQIVVPLDEEAVVREVVRLREEFGVNAVAVSYLFSFLNPTHETRTLALLQEQFPELPVSLSSSIDPKFREYERLLVTAFDAYVRPKVSSYLNDLEQELRRLDYECPLQIMQSNGGITSARIVVEQPVRTILSGPAAGVVAGAVTGASAGFDDVVALDIGGTSFDVALIRGGRIGTGSEGKIGKYPLRIPMVDVHTIGAGGGSIAFLDPAGGLKVGPISAGAVPGPACYARGGSEPTVTDASLLLGFLNPLSFAGGEVHLHLSPAYEAVARHIAEPLRLNVPQAAAGIHDIVNTQMVEAIRLVSVRRGYDLRSIALVAMGGAGPVHAGRLAQMIGARAVVVPLRPGVASAYGLLMADIRHEQFRPYTAAFSTASAAKLSSLFEAIDSVCIDRMRLDGVSLSSVTVHRYAEARYVGQSYELEVPFPDGPIGEHTLSELRSRFHAWHDQYYGHHNPDSEVEFVGIRSVHLHHLPAPPTETPSGASALQSPVGTRRAFFAEIGGYVDAPVYQRLSLSVGTRLSGPAILDQPDTTTVVYPGQTANVHPSGSIILNTA
jgi:N-methylhydantoinase A/oxoprolinase/acetone carboxylase beta subunit